MMTLPRPRFLQQTVIIWLLCESTLLVLLWSRLSSAEIKRASLDLACYLIDPQAEIYVDCAAHDEAASVWAQ